MSIGRRSTNFDPWHYCARCDTKTHISLMLWQRGKLLCTRYCVDERLIGDREQKIAMVLGDGKQELAPVPKIQNPDISQTVDDIMM